MRMLPALWHQNEIYYSHSDMARASTNDILVNLSSERRRCTNLLERAGHEHSMKYIIFMIQVEYTQKAHKLSSKNTYISFFFVFLEIASFSHFTSPKHVVINKRVTLFLHGYQSVVK